MLWRIQCPPGGLKCRARHTALRSLCRGPTLHCVARLVWQALHYNAIRRVNVNTPSLKGFHDFRHDGPPCRAGAT